MNLEEQVWVDDTNEAVHGHDIISIRRGDSARIATVVAVCREDGSYDHEYQAEVVKLITDAPQTLLKLRKLQVAMAALLESLSHDYMTKAIRQAQIDLNGSTGSGE